jgi:hypothetical protein
MLVAGVLAVSLATVPQAVAQLDPNDIGAVDGANAFLLTNRDNNVEGGAVGARRPGLWVQRGIAQYKQPGLLLDSADPEEPTPFELLFGGLLGGSLLAGGADGAIGTVLLLSAIDIVFNQIIDPLVADFTAGIGGGTLPREAVDPTPSNGATNVNVSTLLSWADGGRATSFDVYLGIDSDLRQEDRIASNQAGTSVDPGQLSPDTEYFWRVDSKNSAGTTRGIVWSFVTGSETP